MHMMEHKDGSLWARRGALFVVGECVNQLLTPAAG